MHYANLVFAASCLVLTACGGGGDAALQASGNASVITSSPAQATQTTPIAPNGVPVVAAQSPVNTCSLPNYQADMLRAVNEARAQARTCGQATMPAVAAMSWNSALFSAAAAHSQDMATRDYFSHITPEGATPGERAKQAGYSYSNLAENIAAGQSGIAAVMQGWLNSEGHCSAIMNGTYTQVAVACVATARFKYPSYWTMELGKPA